MNGTRPEPKPALRLELRLTPLDEYRQRCNEAKLDLLRFCVRFPDVEELRGPSPHGRKGGQGAGTQ